MSEDRAAGPARTTRGDAADGRRRAVLALGSNMGDRLANLQGAVDALGGVNGLTLVAISPVYETAPVGGPPQPAYLNAVLVAETDEPALKILERARAAEKAFHRSREIRWGPRTLDIDIIVCGDEVSDDPELTLPHPRAHERDFVLRPWLDADPAADIPGRGRVADLLAGQPATRMRRFGRTLIQPPGK